MRKNNFSLIKFLYENCVKHYAGYVFIITCACAYWAFDLNIRSYLNKLLIDKIVTISKENALIILAPLLFYYFFSLFIRFLIMRLYELAWAYYSPQMQIRIFNKIFNHMMRNSNVIFNKKNMENYSNKIQEAIRLINDLLEFFINRFVCHFLGLIFSAMLFFKLSLNFFLLLMSLIVFFAISSYYSYLQSIRLSKEFMDSKINIFGEFNDLFLNLFHLKIFNNYDYEQDRINFFYNDFKKKSLAKDKMDLFFHSINSLLFMLYQFCSILLLIFEYKAGKISIGDFMLVFAVNKDIVECLWAIVNDVMGLSEKVGPARSLISSLLIEKHYLLQDGKSIRNLVNFDIEFKNVAFSYDDKKILFDDLSFKIEKNEKIGLIGYSGSGKSTIVNLLLKFCKANKGQILIGGVDIEELDEIYLHSVISILSQDLLLFNRTIKDNIQYGKLDATFEEIKQVAKLAKIDDFIENLEDKYETLVENQGANLSYGQKQRILIARAFLKNSKILILDEATSALDNNTEKHILDSIELLSQDKTLIVIAHKLKTLKNLNRLIVMNEGKIIEQGSHEELIKNNGFYYELFNNL